MLKRFILSLLTGLCLVPSHAVEVDESVLDSIQASVEIPYIDIPYTQISFIDTSYLWEPLRLGMEPRVNWVKAMHDCFGEYGSYTPDSMTYLGWTWEDLVRREEKEGFTKSISDEWVKLLKELKHYLP